MRERRYVLFATCMVALLGVVDAVRAAEIKVLSDGPLKPALVNIAEAFGRETGHTVQLIFGLSPVIHNKVMTGEAGDVLIIQPNFLDELMKSGKVMAGEHPVIAHVGIGLAMRSDASTPEISTPEAFKRALLSADMIVFNNVASGNYFAKVLERVGIADAVKDKVVRTPPPEVFVRVLRGKGNDIAVGVVPQVMTTKGLKLIGVLPPEFQSDIAYSAALLTNAQQLEAAAEFVGYLASPQAKAQFSAAGAN